MLKLSPVSLVRSPTSQLTCFVAKSLAGFELLRAFCYKMSQTPTCKWALLQGSLVARLVGNGVQKLRSGAR